MQSFNELLNLSIAFYRKNLGKVLGLSLVTGVAFLAFSLITPHVDPHRVNGSIILLGIILGVIYIAVATVVTIAFYLLLGGQDKSVVDLLKLALPKLGSTIWVAILAGLATIVGFLLLIVPGIIVSIWLTFAIQVLVLEDKTGPAALKASREYVRGHWWAIFGRLFLLGIVLIGATIVFSIVVAILGAITGPSVKAFISNLFSIFILTPIATIFSYYLYRAVAHPEPKVSEAKIAEAK